MLSKNEVGHIVAKILTPNTTVIRHPAKRDDDWSDIKPMKSQKRCGKGKEYAEVTSFRGFARSSGMGAITESLNSAEKERLAR
jgi:hypothetical protein